MSVSPLLPPATIGILGGRQCDACSRWRRAAAATRVAIFTDEKPGCPAGQWSDAEFNADYTDQSALERFLSRVDVVTVEFETSRMPVSRSWRRLSRSPSRPQSHPHNPAPGARELLRDQGIACADFRIVEDLAGLEQAVAALGRPCVIKTAAFGYDGKGQCKVNADTDLTEAWKAFVGHHAVVEQWVPFVCEISVVGARGVDGRMAVHGVVENQHAHHILDLSISPARVEPAIVDQALELWEAVAVGLEYVGTMAVEMFVTAEGRVLVNEIAPRPHNSGHFTIDACVTNQFQQQLRAICGLSLETHPAHACCDDQSARRCVAW